MTTCVSCGFNVTGKKFCPECGTPVQQGSIPVNRGQVCPRCSGEVKPGAAFCMHCGTSLHASSPTSPPPPALRPCPVCHVQVPMAVAFCTQCGQNMQGPVANPVGLQCVQCGRQNAADMRFCGGCGAQLGSGYAVQAGSAGQYTAPAYPQQQQSQPQLYGRSDQYPPQAQPYGQGQGGYSNQVQPMLGQQPMALRCPTCMAMAPLGSANCLSCRTSLVGVPPMPTNMPMQGQPGGIGGFLQGNGGKVAMGVLGGAAAVIGGELLMNGLENQIEGRVEENMGFGGHNHHHRRDEEGGLLGGLGKLADDIGLI